MEFSAVVLMPRFFLSAKMEYYCVVDNMVHVPKVIGNYFVKTEISDIIVI